MCVISTLWDDLTYWSQLIHKQLGYCYDLTVNKQVLIFWEKFKMWDTYVREVNTKQMVVKPNKDELKGIEWINCIIF